MLFRSARWFSLVVIVASLTCTFCIVAGSAFGCAPDAGAAEGDEGPQEVMTLSADNNPATDSLVLRFASELAAGRPIRARIGNGKTDNYQFFVDEDGTIDISSGSERGVLYAVYDVLAGKTSGDETPAFSIRGLFPCDATQRHTPEMMRKLIDRMGRWRMNTLPVITHYGYCEHAKLIDRECAKRGIDVVHYTYCQLAFCDGIPPKYFAVDQQGNPRPPYDRLENMDRLCASNAEGLELYRRGVRRYLEQHRNRKKLLFATPDGADYCECPGCRTKGSVGQGIPFFEIFMEESQGKGFWREYLAYYQRYKLPEDISWVNETDAVMFDTHTRNALFPLHDPDRKAGRASRHEPVDSRAENSTRNRYLFDRLLEWRAAYSGKLYVHENLMMQGYYGVPNFNTRIYLEDLRQFQKAGIDGVVYEAFECGIRPFVPILEVIARAMWDPSAEYEINDDAYPQLHDFYNLARTSQSRCSWTAVRDLMAYLLARPDRDQFDWLFIGYDSMKRAYRAKQLSCLSAEEREFVEKRKLWDFMEGRPDSHEVTGRLIEQIAEKLDQIPER